jgi:hypothetical protein
VHEKRKHAKEHDAKRKKIREKQWALRCPPERKQWVPDTRQ